MAEKGQAKSLLEYVGQTFDKVLTHQKKIQNFVNGTKLFKENALKTPLSLAKLVSNNSVLKNAYTDALINLSPNKINLKANTISQFLPQDANPLTLDNSISSLALSLNNPYALAEQATKFLLKEADKIGYIQNDENAFLLLLNDLKDLYTGQSFADSVNEARKKKIDTLINYFSNFNETGELSLDEKKCLVYRNLQTNVKFSVYVDFFIKYPQDTRSKVIPMYFQEIFLDKILNSQVKFTPTIRHLSGLKIKNGRRKKRHTPSKQINKSGF